MASFDSGKLERRLAVLTDAARRKASYRRWVREDAAVLARIRAALANAGIDPAQVSAVRRLASAERILARIGDSPELQQADAAILADDPRRAGRESFAERAAARAADFVNASPPADGASPFDWYAWSLSRAMGAARDASQGG